MIGRGVGSIVRTVGELLEAHLPACAIGSGIRIRTSGGDVIGRVAGLERRSVTIAPFGSLAGISLGDRVEVDPGALRVALGYAPLGRALDARCEPLDARPPIRGSARRIAEAAPPPNERVPIATPSWTGVRAIDALLTIGRGARIAIFGPPGTGKSTLLETIARASRADAVVVALVGERGREAAAWVARIDRRMAMFCATSDRAASERLRAAELALAQAEFLRAAGGHVLLIVDSLARIALAMRESRAAIGEPVGRGGFPAAVFADLARYLERCGTAAGGSITLIATLLSEPDDDDPLAEAARSFLDGHIVLSRALARAGRFPAIDVLASASRTMPHVATAEHIADAALVRASLALLDETRDARRLGLADLSEPQLASAAANEAHLASFLAHGEPSPPEQTLAYLAALARHVGGVGYVEPAMGL